MSHSPTIVLTLLLTGCGAGSAPEADEAMYEPAPAKEEARSAMPKASRSRVQVIGGVTAEAELSDAASDAEAGFARAAAAPPPGAPPADDDAGPTVRQWFPEALVWAPALTTGDDGTGSVALTAPDSLTAWCILGLAHTDDGRQAGTVATFRTGLPTTVDVSVPQGLVAGDVLEAVVEVTHSAADPLEAGLQVMVDGAATASASRPLTLASGDRVLDRVRLAPEGPGTIELAARIGAADAVLRTVQVAPRGRPVPTRGAGLLRGEAALPSGPEGVDPSRPARLEVTVHAGGLSLLQAELDRVAGRGSEQAVVGWALLRQIEALATASGASLDPAVLRRQRIRAWQHLLSTGLDPRPLGAARLLAALGPEEAEEAEVVTSTRARLLHRLVQAQRGDGAWSFAGDGSSLPRVLADTAFAALSLPPTEALALARVQGLFERYDEAATDPLTAAMILSTGLVEGALAEPLVQRVTEAFTTDEAGRVEIVAGQDAETVFGSRPSRTELLAWYALGLEAHDAEAAGTLTSALLLGYTPTDGWSAGSAAVHVPGLLARTLPPVPDRVPLQLVVDGEVRAVASLQGGDPLTPAVLSVEIGPEEAAVLRTDADALGVAFTATRTTWLPWTPPEDALGVTLDVAPPSLRVGEWSTWTVSVSAPPRARPGLVLGLPPGVEVDVDRVEALPGVRTAQTVGDGLVLDLASFDTGERRTLALPVRARWAGTLSTRPSEVTLRRETVLHPPVRWTLRP